MKRLSARANITAARTYQRPGERWVDSVERFIYHTDRLSGFSLSDDEKAYARHLFTHRKALPAGRTMWLGGTDIAFNVPASQFNCSFLPTQTPSHIRQAFWLLLQGCGVGFHPQPGQLYGYHSETKLTILRRDPSKRLSKGHDESVVHCTNGRYYYRIGDSARSWAKFVEWFVSVQAQEIVVSTENIRDAGTRLKGYGWISSGDNSLVEAIQGIHKIRLSKRENLLDTIDILDIVNYLGTVLSSRRSAEIALCDEFHPDATRFASAKWNYFPDNKQRGQSNNSLILHDLPSVERLNDLFEQMLSYGGSEPGFLYRPAALHRAPWFKGCNPCAEILLASFGFCNLVTVNAGAFASPSELYEAIHFMARLNYRQTMVDLRDGMLDPIWHETNEYLRLCGVSITGQFDVGYNLDYAKCRMVAHAGAYAEARKFGLELPKNVTTIKPEGTASKVMDAIGEGVHRPLGKYVFNNIKFSVHDPLVQKLERNGYRVFEDPYDSGSVLATFPVESPRGPLYNNTSAVEQIRTYEHVMKHYCDQNVSITVSYDPDEIKDMVPEIRRLMSENNFVGMSFILRSDPSKTAADLGYPYIPQECVTEDVFREYENHLTSENFDGIIGAEDREVDLGKECAGGVCPVK